MTIRWVGAAGTSVLICCIGPPHRTAPLSGRVYGRNSFLGMNNMGNEQKSWAGSTVRAIVDDRSIIDSQALEVNSVDDATSFLKSYGFDCDIPAERQELASIRDDAIVFLEEALLRNGQEIPASVRDETDIRRLLLWASERNGSERAKWSCALLRVMHTFAHCGSVFTDLYEGQIREQILDRIQPHIRREHDKVFVGDIEIAHFDSRPLKSRHSAVLKMLHKVENVSTDIFDWFGIRIVIRDRLDAIRVLDYLVRHNVVMAANIKASRTRNTLLDFDQIKYLWSGIGDLKSGGPEGRMFDYPNPAGQRPGNPFSGATFHALQFTCRHRVRINEPDGREIRFFFPYEVQILDEESFTRSRTGRDSHQQYKRRQLDAARRRVLPFIRRTKV